jgi:hypothetical protein
VATEAAWLEWEQLGKEKLKMKNQNKKREK